MKLKENNKLKLISFFNSDTIVLIGEWENFKTFRFGDNISDTQQLASGCTIGCWLW